MATKKRTNFGESLEGIQTKDLLLAMATDKTYYTVSTYIANAEQYPDNLIPFVEKHMAYLETHPSVDPHHYIANLRLSTRIRHQR